MAHRIAVVGLGYVGLPVALAMARRFADTVGFDIDRARVAQLRDGIDTTDSVDAQTLRASPLRVTDESAELRAANFYIVTAPTPLDSDRRPDFGPLLAASRSVGEALGVGDVVVFESTVHPGATRELCVPVLERSSGLRCGDGFGVGYSPERINPGDAEHGFERVTKLISAIDGRTLERMQEIYGAVVEAGLHRVTSIEVAEASKLLENIQRDVNVALVNEMARIFDRLGISTNEVIAAASTKWNFTPYWPGLVGGHCVAVDPYYLSERAEALGLRADLILTSRRVNDEMSSFLAEVTLRQLRARADPSARARVAVLGFAFKANVRDIRNSQVPALVEALEAADVELLVHDPLVDSDQARAEYGIELVDVGALTGIDAVILAVPHVGLDALALDLLDAGTPIVVDVKSALAGRSLPAGVSYWSC